MPIGFLETVRKYNTKASVEGAKVCIMCGTRKLLDQFPSYSYTTRQGRPSVRRDSRCKDCHRERRRIRHVKNRDKELERMRLWKETNRERMLSQMTAYRQTERGRELKNFAQRRREQRRKTGADLTRAEVDQLFALQRGRCANCSGKLTAYHVDHILPVALGGRTTKANVQLLCKPCNCSKGARHPIEWARYNGLLV